MEKVRAAKIRAVEQLAKEVRERIKIIEKVEDVTQLIIDFDKMQEEPDTL